MENDQGLTIAVSLDRSIENRPAGADELALIAAYLPELLKEMLSQSETEGD